MYINFLSVFNKVPAAIAHMSGNGIEGNVMFYETGHGVLVATQVSGLPAPEGKCASPVFGFHIHSGNSCTGNAEDQFADALAHYDTESCPHPHHAGDMPPLFGADGYAVSVFLTDRFTVNEVIGRTVIIHSMPDDFTSQPSGNSGKRIACGVIKIF